MNNKATSIWAGRAIIAVMAMVVLLPLLLVGIQERWYRAQANEAVLDGDYEAALSKFSHVLEADPSNVGYRLTRIDWLIRAKQFDTALAEAQAMVDEYPSGLVERPKEQRSPILFRHYDLLARAHQSLGDFKTAIDVIERKVELLPFDDSPQTVNSLAYERSLAGVKLQQSLNAMNQIIDERVTPAQVLYESAMLHATLLKKGNRYWDYDDSLRERTYRLALADFASSIELFQADYERVNQELNELQQNLDVSDNQLTQSDASKDTDVKEVPSQEQDATQNAADGDDVETEEQHQDDDTQSKETDASKVESDLTSSEDTETETSEDPKDDKKATAKSDPLRDFQRKRIQARNRLALSLVQRAALLEWFKDDEAASQDREQVKDLGVSAKELMKQEFDPSEVVNQIASYSAWLDTRGYILYQLDKSEAGLTDLEYAIRLQESVLSWNRYTLQLRAEQSPDIRVIERLLEDNEQVLATLLYHRLLVFEKMGRDEDARRDRLRLEEFGLTPGPHLF